MNIVSRSLDAGVLATWLSLSHISNMVMSHSLISLTRPETHIHTLLIGLYCITLKLTAAGLSFIKASFSGIICCALYRNNSGDMLRNVTFGAVNCHVARYN